MDRSNKIRGNNRYNNKSYRRYNNNNHNSIYPKNEEYTQNVKYKSNQILSSSTTGKNAGINIAKLDILPQFKPSGLLLRGGYVEPEDKFILGKNNVLNHNNKDRINTYKNNKVNSSRRRGLSDYNSDDDFNIPEFNLTVLNLSEFADKNPDYKKTYLLNDSMKSWITVGINVGSDKTIMYNGMGSNRFYVDIPLLLLPNNASSHITPSFDFENNILLVIQFRKIKRQNYGDNNTTVKPYILNYSLPNTSTTITLNGSLDIPREKYVELQNNDTIKISILPEYELKFTIK
ncbi:uncharacterized protein SCDLUD_004787 [Saccharomycodes ludwigii]|uniref:uncharacterized protein n=1 Tax=Saccharomycodes ludwigii TaxID=36035 RepID=UPI001E86D0E7|nr:hypothetical protein SCDLUD_004787 [Saccharomycodes ludwigii]KAH3899347.1 hypothetical protein SCDLUD_004787 [Saccharomycodes ludwigii]